MPYRQVLQGLLERTRDPKQREKLEAQLLTPPAPVAALYLLQSYHRIRRRKGGTGFGPAPIEWPDIDAFCRHSRIHLAPWEIEIIEALDDTFLSAQRPTTTP